MSECITREERRLLDCALEYLPWMELARLGRVPLPTPDQYNKAASDFLAAYHAYSVASLEAAPPAPQPVDLLGRGVSTPEDWPPAPKPGRVEAAPPAPKVAPLGTMPKFMQDQFAANVRVPPKPGRVEEPGVTEVSYVLDRLINERDLAERFREDLKYARKDYRKERAEHEALRGRLLCRRRKHRSLQRRHVQDC
jgi:hypothetical protein